MSKMQILNKRRLLTVCVIASASLMGCTVVPLMKDPNPEFKTQMEGKTLGEAKGNPALWGQTEESISKKIFIGRTTKSDIRAKFGSTTNVLLSENGENWTFESSVVTFFSSASYTKNTLIILFDNSGIVKRYSMNVDTR